jgi:hypothetical protein
MYKILITLICFLPVFFKVYGQNPHPVLIIPENEEIPKTAQLLGELRFTNGGTYTDVREEASKKTLLKGGNVLQQIILDKPQNGRGTYKFVGDVYRMEDPRPLIDRMRYKDDSISREIIKEDAPYSILYVYRPSSYYGSLINYNLFLGDSLISRVRPGTIQKIKIHQRGEVTLSAKTESKISMNMYLEHGNAYFLRCDVTSGIFIGRPELMQVDNSTGITDVRLMTGEIKKVKEKKDYTDDIYK